LRLRIKIRDIYSWHDRKHFTNSTLIHFLCPKGLWNRVQQRQNVNKWQQINKQRKLRRVTPTLPPQTLPPSTALGPFNNGGVEAAAAVAAHKSTQCIISCLYIYIYMYILRVLRKKATTTTSAAAKWKQEEITETGKHKHAAACLTA